MSDQDTNNNENTKTTEQAATDTAPNLKDTAEGTNTTHEPHKYFIPGIIILVLSVIVVETFYERESTNLVAELTSSDSAEQRTSSGNTEAATAITAETNTTKITQASNTTDITETIEPETKTVVQLNAADSNSAITATNTTSITANEKPVQGKKHEVAASQVPAATGPRAHPAYPPMPYGMSPLQQQRYVEMMERRRNAYAQAMESWRQHMEQRHQYREAVLKRIEQDRREMNQRMEELHAQSERAHADAMQRMEDARKRLMKRPI